MDTKNFEDQLKQFANEWRSRFEDLQKQFSSGKMDASDIFEKQKDHFKNMVVTLKENLDKATDVAKENVVALKSKLEELQVQLSLGKADGTDAFEAQKKKIELAMHEVFIEGKKIFNESFDMLLKQFDHNAQAFKTGMEILKLQFSLGKMDSKDDAEKVRKEINEKMNEMSNYFKQIQQTGKENLEQWSNLMKGNFDKMKSFAEDLMKKK